MTTWIVELTDEQVRTILRALRSLIRIPGAPVEGVQSVREALRTQTDISS